MKRKKNTKLANEMKLLEGRNQALEDRVGFLEKSNTKYEQYHQTPKRQYFPREALDL